MTPQAIVLALLSMFPYMSGNNRQCIIDRQPQIEVQLHEVTQPIAPGAPVPPVELVAAVGFAETHLGCDSGEGGNWGAPISPLQRHTAGTHMHAAVALVHGYQRCHSWDGAIMRFRTGLCDPAHQGATPQIRAIGVHYLNTIHAIMRRLQARD